MDRTIHNVEVVKNAGETSFGFSVHKVAGSDHIIVKTVAAGGPANRAGINPNDNLLAILGQSVVGKTVKEAGAIIGSAQDGRLTIALSRAEESNSDKENDMENSQNSENTTVRNSSQRPMSPIAEASQQDQATFLNRMSSPQPDPVMIYKLEKWEGTGYGFSIQQSAEGFKVILKVDPNTPAHAGGVQVNSILCLVNSKEVISKNYPDTVKMIKETGAKLELGTTTEATARWFGKASLLPDHPVVRKEVVEPAPPVPRTTELSTSVITDSMREQSKYLFLVIHVEKLNLFLKS